MYSPKVEIHTTMLFTKVSKGLSFGIGYAIFCVVFFATPSTIIAQGNCECTNCPQFMPDNFTGNFLINVQNASNPTLGQNGQGVCGVNINFDHEYVGDLSITLTSPAGQSVTLVGPIGLFGETDGTIWNVGFLPCSDPSVSPDPGFSNTWNNNQPWGLGGNYSGSYYPATGCLENFNTGPVNGTWTLTVIDGQAQDVGNFLDYEIIFCDPSGIDCFSCAANAGELTQPDLSACEGASTLDLTLPPTYTPPNVQPPTATYSYTYVVSGPGGIILEYNPDADLSGFPPGVYSVCGMSYLTAQEPLIPDPNGALTVNQLRTLLNSGTAPLCAKVTTNCVTVTINMAPEDVETFVEICAPQCYVFNNISRCQSGTYVANLSLNGCPYTSTLYLTVNQPKLTNLTEFICNGGCSSNPAFPTACGSGSYQEVLQTAQGCDSTINLTLTNIVSTAVIANQPVVPCGGGTVQLQGAGSSSGGGYTYSWSASNGGVIVGSTSLINANISAAGTYQLKVCRSQGGIMCCDSASVDIDAATTPPNAPAVVNGQTPLCLGQAFNFNIAPVAGASSYTWSVPPGATINSGGSGLLANISFNSGTGGQVCVTANNGCGASDPTCFNVNTGALPVATAPQGSSSVCAANNGNYSIPSIPNATGYTWTVNAPAQIISGQGTNAVQIAWNGATAANLCVTATNACGTSTSECLPITIANVPAVPSIAGANMACTQATDTYTITPIAGATNYVWTVTGGVVTSGQGTTSAQVTWNNGASGGTVCVAAGNTCGESSQTCFNVSLSAPPAQPTVSGDNDLCPGETATYTASTVAGAMGYTWTVPTGATILSGQGTNIVVVRFDAAPGGNVSVAVNGSCGTAPQVPFAVSVNPFPTANAGANILSCGTSANMNALTGSGVWSQLSGPGTTVFANANTANSAATASQPGTYNYIWTVNALGCVATDTVSINYESLPAAGVSNIVCDPANENYTVSFPITGGSAPYTLTGGTVTNGVFTSNAIPSGQPYQFTIIDNNNCNSAAIAGSYNCNCATNAGSMSLMPLQACGTETVNAQQLTLPTLDGNDIGAYVLHEGAGVTLVNPIAQNTTGIFSYQPGMTYGQTYYIAYAVGNNIAGLPNPTDPCFSVAQGQPVVFNAIPAADAGTVLVNCGNTITLNATGAGTWSTVGTPVGGALNFTNANNPTTNVGTTIFGTYTLEWTVAANGCANTDQTQITFNPIPAVANVDRICDPTNQFYTVNFDLSGGTAPYIINGTTIVGSTYTSAQLSNGQSYTLTVSDSEGCTTTAVAGSFACNCATDAGTMSSAPLKACATQTVQAAANNDTNLDGNDVVAYILHDAPGTVAGNIIDQNATGLFGFQAGMVLGQTYYISRIAGNPAGSTVDPADPCLSVAAGQEVVFLEVPAPSAGPDVAVCGTTATLEGVQGVFGGQWTFVSGPGTTTIVSPTLANSEVGATQVGTYTFRWTATNDICTGSDLAEVQFRPLPEAAVTDEACNATNTQYAVMVTVDNGTAPYSISGLTGSFAGGVFTSGLLPTNTQYAFTVTDANGCTTGPITGVKNCNCSTDAGSMEIAPLVFCAFEPAVATWDNNGQLDGDDLLQFVLHTSGGLSLGQILATSSTPEFAFGTGLVIGQTYYISAIAGNNINGSVDPTDPCFSIAAGTPVRWKAVPNATLAGTASICEGGNTTLTFNGTGQFPLTVTWEANGTTFNTAITGTQGATENVTPMTTTVYSIVSVQDGDLPTCTTNLTESVTVTVNQLAGAGVASLPLEFCVGESQVVSLADLLTGEDTGGAWTEISTSPSSGGAFNAATGSFNTSNLSTGTYTFRYQVNPVAPCPPDAAEVSVIVRPKPAADAGADQTIDCNTPSVTLGGVGTSAGQFYQWSTGAGSIAGGNERFVSVNQAGNYNLLVTNQFGCTQTDAVTVGALLAPPIFEGFGQKAISCFGENDGQITVGNVSGGTPPYEFALNSGPFTNTTTYGPLAPGTYTLEVVDANGCVATSDSIVLDEPVEVLADLGADLLFKLGDTAQVDLQLTVPFSQLGSIVWEPLLDSLHAGQATQVFLPTKPLEVQVTVKDTNGCEATDRLEIRVDRRRNIYVPTVFTPAAGDNNIITIYGGNDVASIKYFQIYDRWGAMVHETTNFQPGDLSKGWSGNIDGKAAQPAVFVWVAAVVFKDGATEIFGGDVAIVR